MVLLVSGVGGPTGLCAARLNVELQATNTELVSAAVPTLHGDTLTAVAMMRKLKLVSMSLVLLLEPGVSGLLGLTVPRLVDLDTETELVLVAVQLQLLVETTVLDWPRIKDSAR